MFASSVSFGAAHIGISYSDSITTSEQEYKSSSGSASFSFDIGTYFNIGLTGRNQYSYAKGYEKDERTNQIQYSETKMSMTSYSIDLSIILYPGDVFVPYIFGGYVTKYLSSKKVYGDPSTGNQAVIERNEGPVPDYQCGGGVGLRFSERFSLKYSVTFTPGTKLLSDGTGELTMDRYQSIGLSYKI